MGVPRFPFVLEDKAPELLRVRRVSGARAVSEGAPRPALDQGEIRTRVEKTRWEPD
jgi:hypothetical protein